MKNLHLALILGVLLLAAGLSGPAAAQDGSSKSDVPYHLLRHEEPWHEVAGQEDAHPFKYRPIGSEKVAFATIGGEVRTYGRWYRNKRWGAGPDTEGSVLQRFMLHGAVETPRHSGEKYARFFGQLRSGFVTGRAGPPYPTDKDRLGVNQAFLEVGAPVATGRGVLRLGRQELHYGAGRMIAAREGPNIRLGYDAVLARYAGEAWQADAFVAKPTEATPGMFDNGWISGRTLWGAYIRRQSALLNVSVYYLGTERAPSPQRRDLRATRHTVGARGQGRVGPIGVDLEGALQLGRYRSAAGGEAGTEGRIQAWTVAGHLTYRRPDLAGQPTLGGLFDVSSGDAPNTEIWETFAAPYPSGRFTGAGSQLGPGNLLNLGPHADLQLLRGLRLQLKGHFFWRLRTTEGIYAIWGAPLRPVPSASARYVGVMPEMTLTWTTNRHTTLALEASHFLPGPALEKTPPADGLTHVGLRATYRF